MHSLQTLLSKGTKELPLLTTSFFSSIPFYTYTSVYLCPITPSKQLFLPSPRTCTALNSTDLFQFSNSWHLLVVWHCWCWLSFPWQVPLFPPFYSLPTVRSTVCRLVPWWLLLSLCRLDLPAAWVFSSVDVLGAGESMASQHQLLQLSRRQKGGDVEEALGLQWEELGLSSADHWEGAGGNGLGQSESAVCKPKLCLEWFLFPFLVGVSFFQLHQHII